MLARTLRQQTRSFHSTIRKMGVTIQSLAPGDGVNFPKPGDRITIHYTGTLDNGSTFDSSRTRGAPFQAVIGVGQLIRGWDEGIPKLSVGEKAVLKITPDYGYGERGFPPVIPQNSNLTFEVELLKIN